MVKEIKGTGVGGLSESRFEEKMEERVERMVAKHHNETARAIA
jgi:hypothetical protein